MSVNIQVKFARKPAGYEALIERYGLDTVPNWHRSFVAQSGEHRIDVTDGVTEETYPLRYWPGESSGDHLEFALKYDGTNLAILFCVFRKMAPEDILDYVLARPTSKYVRRLWFFYEFLTGKRLPLEDLKQGNYIDLLDPREYYAISPARRVRRQRINENLPGNEKFCSVVRRTEVLRAFEAADFPGRCRRIVSSYSPDLLQRALGYLYTKETKSSFGIEYIEPTPTRTERFVSLLQTAERDDFCEKDRLIALQNRVVDVRFRDSDYRNSQNYVGETIAWGNEKIHFVGPRPEDLADLMDGLLDAHRCIENGNLPAVIHAAVVAWGFVFLHPFEDGNGRIHRFLIHNILARRGFTPEGLMFPVSAAMLKDRAGYDSSLEAFSRPLMLLVDYSLDEEGRMNVANDTAVWYRYIDMTPQAEALSRFIERTVDTELAGELDFLANYDRTKRYIQEIADIPDRDIDLFIRFCLQNDGRLSARKRTDYFASLSDAEVERMELAVRAGYSSRIGE